MKTEILTKLEKLLETDNIFSVQQEFKQLSAQFKSLIDHGRSEEDEVDDEDPEDAHYAAEVKAKDAHSPVPQATKESATDSEQKPDTETKAEAAETPAESTEQSTKKPEEEKEIGEQAETLQESETDKKETPPSVKSGETAETGDTISETEPDSVAASKEQASEAKPEEADTAEKSAEGATPEKAETPEKSEESKEGSQEESESFTDAKAHFNALQDKFKQRIEKERTERKRIEEETVETAKALLEELQKLVENEENIGKAFNGFNAIQEKWKSLPRVSNDAYRDLNAEYNKYAEKFFYNINIYKELKELDLKHNLEQKQQVIENQKKLLELNDIRRMEVEVRLNQDRWNEIGPTFKEEWDKIKDEFWSITRQVYKKIQAFYDERREQQEKNYEAKEKILNRLKHVLSLNLKSYKKWKDKTREVKDLQKEWKMIGFVPKEKKHIWKEFNKGCDTFFENKRMYHKELFAVQDANKEAKQNLLNQAEELKDSEDWRNTSRKLIQLQKEWKKIGAAHQRDENRLWRNFRAACDAFFENMKAQKAEAISGQKENLEAKKKLLQTMEAFEPGTDPAENVNQLKAFSAEWRQIGHVPYKQKDEINGAYKKLLDEKFKALKIDKQQKEKIRFEQKLDDIREGDGNEHRLRKEQDAIRGKISMLKNEKIQLDNNMGFFANSKGANKLKEDVERKIAKINDEIKVLKERLSLLREV